MKHMRKAIFRNVWVQSVLGALAAVYLWLVRVTSRWTDEGRPATEAAWSGAEPVIIAFWHNRLLMMPYCWSSRTPFHMLISGHADGRLIAKSVKWFGISTITGSSSQGGAGATRALVKLLKTGGSVGITPDGPRGPRMRAGDGPLALAKLSGVKIVPAAVSVSHRKVLSSWDRLIIPLPFSRGVRIWGTPIDVPKDSTPEDFVRIRQVLEDALTAVSNRADTLVGQACIAPAEHPERDSNDKSAEVDNARA